MNICNKHDVAHETYDCPACTLQEQLTDAESTNKREIKDLTDERDELSKENGVLEDRIADLERKLENFT